jgi:hypothetical protein
LRSGIRFFFLWHPHTRLHFHTWPIPTDKWEVLVIWNSGQGGTLGTKLERKTLFGMIWLIGAIFFPFSFAFF